MTQPIVPFLDLHAQHGPLRDDLLVRIQEVIDRSAFAGGSFVAAFEADFARYCRTEHAIGVGSGTDALWLTLLALGIGPGDEVITVAATFIATAEAITYTGATPVFVDIDEQTFTLDPEKFEAAITPRTKAVIPVHLYGQMADMDAILEIAQRRHLHVVEDACQAHGAEYRGQRAGSLGLAGCFSFYPGKNLGALGEAGAIVTNDAELAHKLRMLRDHGQAAKYQHALIGWNARMDGIQGAVLQLKLRDLDRRNAARRDHASAYNRLLASAEHVITPVAADDGVPVYHLYAVRVNERDRVLAAMSARGIACGIHYPVPVHLQPAYRDLGYRPGSLPVTERWAREVLSLPMFPELTPAQIETVVAGLKAVLPAHSTRSVLGA